MEKAKGFRTRQFESCFVEILQKNTKSVILGCVYRPPDGSRYLDKNFNATFKQTLTSLSVLQKEVIILGDFNTDYLKRNIGRELKDMLTLFGFKQLIKEPTRITEETSTLIDIILTNNNSVISKVGVLPLSLSDHDILVDKNTF